MVHEGWFYGYIKQENAKFWATMGFEQDCQGYFSLAICDAKSELAWASK